MTRTTVCERNGEGHFASEEAGFVDVGSLEQVPSGTTMRVTVGAAEFTLVNVDGRVLAVGDLCLRCSRSLSTAGYAGGLLTCPGCGWKYDLQRGCVDALPNLRIETHEVRIEDGRLLLASAITAPVSPP